MRPQEVQESLRQQVIHLHEHGIYWQIIFKITGVTYLGSLAFGAALPGTRSETDQCQTRPVRSGE